MVVMVLAGATLAGSSCNRPSPETRAEKATPPSEAKPTSVAKKEERKKPYRHEGYAVWYVVPDGSLAKRRAGKDELTAAHNHLPLGTTLRVTHLGNGKSVIVHVTDRGITKKGASIDLCKEAAEKLDMIGEGMARVRMEELSDDKELAASPDSTAAAANP
jgi:rare lipoprotein A